MRHLVCTVLIISLTLKASAVSPAVKAYKIGYRTPANQTLSNQELKFIISFKAYLAAILQIQASETRKKILCLGGDYRSMQNLKGTDLENLLGDNGELAQLLLKQFDEYKYSEECKNFLKVEVQEIFRSYSEMKAYLALHQSTNDEIVGQIYRLGSLGNSVEVPIDCESMQKPIGFLQTTFCFDELRTLINPHPDHILRSVSFKALDQALGWALKKQKIPSVLKLDPLTWDEVLLATDLFNVYYSNNEYDLENKVLEIQNNFDKKIKDGDSDHSVKYSEGVRQYERMVRVSEYSLENYWTASNFQAQGTYVFSDYPQNSAPKKYVELLTKHPVLAFYQPALKPRQLDCQDTEAKNGNWINLCEAYKKNYTNRVSSSYGLKHGIEVLSYGLSARKDIYPQLRKAYEKVLELNLALIGSLNLKYDTKSVFMDPTESSLITNVSNHNESLSPLVSDLDMNEWSDLMSMNKALEYFLFLFPEYQGAENNFVKRQMKNELITIGLMIGGAVGLGVACGFMGGWPLVACLAASTAGVNVFFYNDSLNRHNEVLVKHFSMSSSETKEGIKLGLIDFEKARTEVQALYLDTLLIGVGAGLGKLFKVISKSFALKNIKNVKLK